MAISDVIASGIGSWSSVNKIPTMGYSVGDAVAIAVSSSGGITLVPEVVDKARLKREKQRKQLREDLDKALNPEKFIEVKKPKKKKPKVKTKAVEQVDFNGLIQSIKEQMIIAAQLGEISETLEQINILKSQENRRKDDDDALAILMLL